MIIDSKILLSDEDIKPSFKDWFVEGVLNPAAIRTKNGKIVLYARISEKLINKNPNNMVCPVVISKNDYQVEHHRFHKGRILKTRERTVYITDGLCRLPNISHLRRIDISKDGFNVEKIDEKPTFFGYPGDGDYGVEDPRFTQIGNKIYMTYVNVSASEGVCTSLAETKDLKKWVRKGIIFRQQNKDVVLFPEKIKGKYVALHRPEGTIEFSRRTIWISHSPDLIHWGNEKSIIQTRNDSWDSAFMGSGAPPIKTKEGWLIIHHGARKDANDESIYSAGAALLDLKNPEIVLARSPTKEPLLSPSESYEKEGFVSNVVFPTGAIMDLDKKHLLIYSGGADKVISVKKIKIDDILSSMEYYK